MGVCVCGGVLLQEPSHLPVLTQSRKRAQAWEGPHGSGCASPGCSGRHRTFLTSSCFLPQPEKKGFERSQQLLSPMSEEGVKPFVPLWQWDPREEERVLRAGHCRVGKGPLEQWSQQRLLLEAAAITSGQEDLGPQAVV